MQRLLFRVFIGVIAVIAVMAIWIAADLYRPYKVDIRAFDADEIARLDTAMWRSYYSRRKLKLFGELGDLLESQFHFPFWRRCFFFFRFVVCFFY